LVEVSSNCDFGPIKMVEIPPVNPDEELEVSIPIITPLHPGDYTAFYRTQLPTGQYFGNRLWTDIEIK